MSNENKGESKKQSEAVSMSDLIKNINALAGRSRGTGDGSGSGLSAEEKQARKLARQEKHVTELRTLTYRARLKKGEDPVEHKMNPGQVVRTVVTAIRNGLSAAELEKATGGKFRDVEFDAEVMKQLPENANKWEQFRPIFVQLVLSFNRPKDENKRKAILVEVLRAFKLDASEFYSEEDKRKAASPAVVKRAGKGAPAEPVAAE